MISNKIKTLRIERGMSQSELSSIIGVSTVSVSAWENGTKAPSVKYLVPLSNALHISLYELLGAKENFDAREGILIQNFRKLDSYGKDAVEIICEHELQRVSSICIDVQRVRKPSRGQIIRVFRSPAAAGIAAPIPGDEFDDERMEDIPSGADFGVRIQGDSMSPKILDGDIVFVRRAEYADNNQIGIFCVDGAIYCKQIKRSESYITLWSINRDRSDADITIMRDSTSCLSTIGVVIGVKHTSSE